MLARLLSRAGPLPAIHPEDGELIRKGHIYVAPPDRHMIVERGHLRVIQGPRENRNRPAIDPTFRSAALTYGPRVVGVVLTGLLDDGTSGLMVIHKHGGIAVVEDPKTAMFPSMPKSALERVPGARIASLENMSALIEELVESKGEVAEGSEAAKDPTATFETRIAELDMAEIENEMRAGEPSQFACPECGGVLWEINQSGLLRFRCRVGHAFTARNLRVEHRQAVEAALWAGLRALEESASLYHRMAERARNSNHDRTTKVYEERASAVEEKSRTLRDFLVNLNGSSVEQSSDMEETGA
jgi:two-component system chemotaxis response regulator CheB